MIELATVGSSSVCVRCEGVLYSPQYTAGASELYAFSIVGQEQACRAIAACCSIADPALRPSLRAKGPSRNILLKWQSSWSCQTTKLGHGLMHMVALPGGERVHTKKTATVTIGDDDPGDPARRKQIEKDKREIREQEARTPIERMLLPRSESELPHLLYQTLFTDFSTPLIPFGLSGQSEVERLAGELWMKRITDILLQSDHWKRLHEHDDQDRPIWPGAGRLTLSNFHLDGMVSTLVKRGMLSIPEPGDPRMVASA